MFAVRVFRNFSRLALVTATLTTAAARASTSDGHENFVKMFGATAESHSLSLRSKEVRSAREDLSLSGLKAVLVVTDETEGGRAFINRLARELVREGRASYALDVNQMSSDHPSRSTYAARAQSVLKFLVNPSQYSLGHVTFIERPRGEALREFFERARLLIAGETMAVVVVISREELERSKLSDNSGFTDLFHEIRFEPFTTSEIEHVLMKEADAIREKYQIPVAHEALNELLTIVPRRYTTKSVLDTSVDLLRRLGAQTAVGHGLDLENPLKLVEALHIEITAADVRRFIEEDLKSCGERLDQSSILNP